jgi:hypothetical protein
MDPMIYRLHWDRYTITRYAKAIRPDPAGRSELSFLPDELPEVARFVAREVQTGRRLPVYDWTPRAWAINPAGPDSRHTVPYKTCIDTLVQLAA